MLQTHIPAVRYEKINTQRRLHSVLISMKHLTDIKNVIPQKRMIFTRLQVISLTHMGINSTSNRKRATLVPTLALNVITHRTDSGSRKRQTKIKITRAMIIGSTHARFKATQTAKPNKKAPAWSLVIRNI